MYAKNTWSVPAGYQGYNETGSSLEWLTNSNYSTVETEFSDDCVDDDGPATGGCEEVYHVGEWIDLDPGQYVDARSSRGFRAKCWSRTMTYQNGVKTGWVQDSDTVSVYNGMKVITRPPRYTPPWTPNPLPPGCSETPWGTAHQLPVENF